MLIGEPIPENGLGVAAIERDAAELHVLVPVTVDHHNNVPSSGMAMKPRR